MGQRTRLNRAHAEERLLSLGELSDLVFADSPEPDDGRQDASV